MFFFFSKKVVFNIGDVFLLAVSKDLFGYIICFFWWGGWLGFLFLLFFGIRQLVFVWYHLEVFLFRR